jgi:hypothetical protein
LWVNFAVDGTKVVACGIFRECFNLGGKLLLPAEPKSISFSLRDSTNLIRMKSVRERMVVIPWRKGTERKI